MKVTVRIDNDPGMFMLNLESENQEESATVFEIAQRVCSPIKAYGRVGPTHTWAWFRIPLKAKWDQYFGNDKS